MDHKKENDRIFLDSIIENLPNMIFIKDAKELRFVLFNKAGEELLGYSREELIGKNDYDFFPKEEAAFFQAKDREVLEGRILVEIAGEPIHTRHKGRRVLRTKKIPLLDASGDPRYLLGISEDITEEKLAEEDLIKKTAELARSRAEKEQLEVFTYLASHDLQEPLQKIIGFSELLKNHAKKDLDAKGQDYLDRIQNAGRRMAQMIHDLLNFSRITTQEATLAPVDLGELVQDVLGDLEMKIDRSGAKVEILSKLPTLRADRAYFRQLFQNLIANALKFRKKTEASLIKIDSRRLEDGRIEISVKDNGIGFDEKNLDRIFKPFERLHGWGEYEGSGMGLAICQKIVLRHHGQITAKSQPGQGAMFIITLPGAASDGL